MNNLIPNHALALTPDLGRVVVEYFYHWEKTTPNAPFLHQPHGEEWETFSFSEVGDIARRLVTALKSRGLKGGDHVGICSKNCAHWFIADIALMIGGFVSVPFYSSLPKEQLSQVIELSHIKALFIGRQDSWGDRSDAIPEELTTIRFPHYEKDPLIDIGDSWEDFYADHAPETASYVPALDDLWTIKFTSGTTGVPKGVMHTYEVVTRLICNESETNWIGLYDIEEPRVVSYLPLNHVAERVAIEVTSIVSGAKVFFVENLDSFAKNVRAAEPTLFFAVPRIWTLFYQGVTSKIPEKKLNHLLKIPIVSKLIKQKILKQLGLHRVQLALTGAAMTPGFVKDFYQKMGIRLMEVYGLTETLGAFTHAVDVNTPTDSVGQAMPYSSVKIDEETNEILVKTPYIMKGYYQAPEKTAETFIGEWFKTGDQGQIDERGNLKITGRVKDIFKTAKGSYVTPAPLEEAILHNPLVGQVCVTGLGLPQPLALINLSDLGNAKPQDAVADSILESVKQLNQQRANFERISTCVIQKDEWTVESGLMTPTLKIKRSELDQRYSAHYHKWHEDPREVIWE